MANQLRPSEIYSVSKERISNYLAEKSLKPIDFRVPLNGEYFVGRGDDHVYIAHQGGLISTPRIIVEEYTEWKF